jgi:hypothetical protein
VVVEGGAAIGGDGDGRVVSVLVVVVVPVLVAGAVAVVMGGGRWQGRRRWCWVVAGRARVAAVGATVAVGAAGGQGFFVL